MSQDEIQKVLYPTEADRKKLQDRLVNGLELDEVLSGEDSSSCFNDDDNTISEDSEPMEARNDLIEKLQSHNSIENANSAVRLQRNDHGKSLIESYVQSEIQAVMRIKLQFFKWFEEYFSKTMNIFLGYNQTDQPKPA